MITLPHNTSDLLFAPVVLALNTRIEALSRYSLDALAFEVALASDVPDWTRQLRVEGLLKTVSANTDRHGWQLEWDSHGLRVTHGERHVILGVPQTFRDYVDGAQQPDPAAGAETGSAPGQTSPAT